MRGEHPDEPGRIGESAANRGDDPVRRSGGWHPRPRRSARSRLGSGLLAAALTTLPPASTSAWWSQVHRPIARAAARALPTSVPTFFRQGAARIAACSADPDLWKAEAAPALRKAEHSNHYINLERLAAPGLPHDRTDYAALPDKVGTLPYAIVEWYERLLLAFAEHRKSPGDEVVQAKALYIAGILAHYAGDAGQPLHSTVDFDGRAQPNGSSPRSGIHDRLDALPDKMGITAEEIAQGLEVEAIPGDAVFASVLAAIEDSHRRVEAVYRLEERLPDWRATPPAEPDPEVRAFALDCCRASARLTARLWTSAWANSARVELPKWHGR